MAEMKGSGCVVSCDNACMIQVTALLFCSFRFGWMWTIYFGDSVGYLSEFVAGTGGGV